MSGDLVRVGIVSDLPEEGWPSMDLVAEMLMTHLGPDLGIDPIRVRAPFVPRLSRLMNGHGAPPVLDRLANRFYDYPNWLRAEAPAADVYHLVDHSYAHLVAVLPAGRTVVTCHDMDAFRPLIGAGASESRLPRALVRRIAAGIGRAAVVTCVSDTTRRELVTSGLVEEARTDVVLNGVHESCTPDADLDADRDAATLLGETPGTEILHVGSVIPRKRIDILLEAFKGVAEAHPEARLIRVGGPFTRAQQRLASTLGIAGRVVVLPTLSRKVLAAVYRRAALVLLPSEREGFGLPLVEAMACGTPVVASDLPVLREVGGRAATYAPVGDVGAWQGAVRALLHERRAEDERWRARQQAGLTRAAAFSWRSGAERMARIYARLAGRVEA